jgi:hypothetical protein
MKRVMSVSLITTFMFASTSFAFASTSFAFASTSFAVEQNGKSCSAKSLAGNYLYAQDGFSDGATPGSRSPFAQAGRETFDGKGNMSGKYTGNFNGVIQRGTYTGTYTVNADCSGSVTFTDNQNTTYHYDIFVNDSGDEFVFVQTDANSITAAFERRRVAK